MFFGANRGRSCFPFRKPRPPLPIPQRLSYSAHRRRKGWSSVPATVPRRMPGDVGARTSPGSSSTIVSHGSERMYSGPSAEAPEPPSSIRFRFSAEPAEAGIDDEDEFRGSAGLRRDESEVCELKRKGCHRYVSCELDRVSGILRFAS